MTIDIFYVFRYNILTGVFMRRKTSLKKFLFETSLFDGDPLLNRVVNILGYKCTSPLKNEEDIYVSEFGIKAFNINSCNLNYNVTIIEEKGKTFEECIEKINIKYLNIRYIIIGQCNKYFGIWPFGTKGVGILVFIKNGN